MIELKYRIVRGVVMVTLPQPDLTLPPEQVYRLGCEHGHALKELEAKFPAQQIVVEMEDGS